MTSNNIFKDRFLQIHLLTSYPPANLNRDDLGRPKTAVMGNVERLRISSQSLKRAWRTSELFSNAFETEIGIRTRKMADEIVQQLQSKGFEKNLLELVKQSLSQLISKGKDQVLHFSQAEQTRLLTEGEAFATSLTEFATTLTGTEKAKEKALKAHLETISQDINIFVNDHKNIDIALFGRMLTSSPKHNMEAACQVAHAITVHPVTLEDDYFTAVDDLNTPEDELGVGSAHIGITEFAAGLFYLYVCIDRQLLLKNLDGDHELAAKTLHYLIEAIATIAPTGKQNSFASRARASFIVAEKGNQQPRSLSVAYLKPIQDKHDVLTKAIQALTTAREKMNLVYGDCANETYTVNAETAEGTLKMLQQFVSN